MHLSDLVLKEDVHWNALCETAADCDKHCCPVSVMMMMMMMMSGFVEHVINNPQMRYRSAKQVGLQMSSKHQGRE